MPVGSLGATPWADTLSILKKTRPKGWSMVQECRLLEYELDEALSATLPVHSKAMAFAESGDSDILSMSMENDDLESLEATTLNSLVSASSNASASTLDLRDVRPISPPFKGWAQFPGLAESWSLSQMPRDAHKHGSTPMAVSVGRADGWFDSGGGWHSNAHKYRPKRINPFFKAFGESKEPTSPVSVAMPSWETLDDDHEDALDCLTDARPSSPFASTIPRFGLATPPRTSELLGPGSYHRDFVSDLPVLPLSSGPDRIDTSLRDTPGLGLSQFPDLGPGSYNLPKRLLAKTGGASTAFGEQDTVDKWGYTPTGSRFLRGTNKRPESPSWVLPKERPRERVMIDKKARVPTMKSSSSFHSRGRSAIGGASTKMWDAKDAAF